jgi:hypothetical protein
MRYQDLKGNLVSEFKRIETTEETILELIFNKCSEIAGDAEKWIHSTVSDYPIIMIVILVFMIMFITTSVSSIFQLRRS